MFASLESIAEHTWLGMDGVVVQSCTCGSEVSSVTLVKKDLIPEDLCRFRGISWACSVSADDSNNHLSMT